MRTHLAFSLAAVLAMAGCGGGSLTLSEYSTEVASRVETLDSSLDAKAEEYLSGPPSVEGAQEYLAARVAGYRATVDGINALDPPDQVTDLHTTLQVILGKILAAEEERRAFADTVESVADFDEVWEGRQAQTIRAAEEEAIVLCVAAQTRFDDTEQREGLGEVPWMPAELKEVVNVALDCP